ncbi:chromosome segregation protein [Malassezia pachydermatis]|uniref:Chromosome segregation protein n=1 Tax=Malassezia pachydermatis TaxID=77020 RepID=A0A0M8MS24_9BASI|nr:chromosome segregation protein [Malassezia pachydermatis]KOS12491.1 chromosome segregation protein [Malassezia pachydermatis]
MAFGQKTHGRRGRPPKDPNARAQRSSLSVEDTSNYQAGPSRTSPPAGTAGLASGFASVKMRKVHSGDVAMQSSTERSSTPNTVEDFELLLEDMRARYEQSVDERVVQANRERDAIQAQFDRLKELRMTQSEKTLAEWKKASETRHRHTLESLSAWKNRAEHAEHRAKELEQQVKEPSAPISSDKTATVALEQLKQEVAALTDKLAESRRELEEEKAKRTALEAQLQNMTSAASVREDEMAIRRMYEDLTGFIVNEVEMHDTVHKQRRYDMIFTGADYYESRLHVSAEFERDSSTASVRDDFVYIPHIDQTRDAALLASDNMPDHFLEQIRFERGAATKFLTALHRSLKK